jgi:CheY-like chemotaxis protein
MTQGSRRSVEEIAFELRTLISNTTGMLEIAREVEDQREKELCLGTALESSQKASELLKEFFIVKDGGFVKPESALPKILAPIPSAERPRLNVLLAEDNVINQRIVRRLLERRGHSITVVENGKAAVERATAENFDLVLIDIMMPVMDGLDAASFIRADEAKHKKPRVPMIAITAAGEAELAQISEVMDEVIQKPFDTGRFMRIVESVIPPKR